MYRMNICDFLQFIDLCIMMGCDYCGSIKGIGMKKSIELIKKHKTIDKVLESIDQSVSMRCIC